MSISPSLQGKVAVVTFRSRGLFGKKSILDT